MGGKLTLNVSWLHLMRVPSKLAVALALVSLSSCGADHCELPAGWVLATALKPSHVVGTPKPLFFAREIRPYTWSWRLPRSSQGSGGNDEELLKTVAAVSALNPQPLLLFHFSDGQSCAELNRSRIAIAIAAGCSKGGSPCLEGTPTQLPSRR
jgi:hypothetical protein